MSLFDTLFGWTGYEPLGVFLSGVNILLNAVFMLILQYYPQRRFLWVRTRTLLLIYAGLFSLFAVFYLSFPALLASTGAGQITGIILGLLVLTPVPFILLKGCVPQNVFATAYALCFSAFVMGIGNFMEFRFGDVLLPGVHSVVAFVARLALIPIFLPLGIHNLQKLFAAWSGRESAAFWKVVWLIPAALFALSMLSGNVVTLTNENSPAFLLSRILSVAALLACVSLMSGIMRREQEMAAMRLHKQMMNTAGKVFDDSYAETLTVWRQASRARKEAGVVVEQILACARTGGKAEISALLRERITGLDVEGTTRLCENGAVNALATYYAAIAQKEGIEISCKLNIPKQAGLVQNIDLSRIVGNMLENAIEACRRMEYGTKSIRLQSKVTGDMLALGLTNSFDGNFEKTADGRYLSKKRESGIATGLASIQSIADKYGGTARFEADGRVFKTSVRLDMGGAEK